MEKLSFFNEKESYNDFASEMEKEIRPHLKNIFEKWSEKGFKFREIQIVLNGLIAEICMAFIAKNRRNLKTSE